MNIIQVSRQFPTQESCIKHLEVARWRGVPTCPYCKSENTNPLTKEMRHHCNGCRKSFSVTVGTIFHDTRLPLQKWFLAISLILNAKKGISARQLARDLEVNKDTAWSMDMRIREAMKDDGQMLTGIIEMDETYVGGKPRKSNKKDDDDLNPPSKRGRGTKKTPVVGMVERKGNVKASKADKNSLKSKDLNELIRKNINAKGSVLLTDEYRGYNKAHTILKHYRINHQSGYVNGQIHTNTIESFWAILKRGIIGQFHKVSAKHLDKYLNEFCYRYNNRKQDVNAVFNGVLNGMLRA
ncbi:MAG: IS1595 family transposase [Rickettsiales bacterium]|nr:IS1595 family transposase [Pseudomonadota bacterium]MDA0966868.1 IS1595 family transposase [Pseudomonadota bacterium]MDG4543543.1 IS1595 family transposase [Rickettsiales bacterium]MDG4545691.1 IS1595 family transposase [Rickettsiales bacterium]MDG4547536.1 IS1595 family transposase [Rickettsiales bacterium]